jgi:hypothetical protein
MKATSGWLLAAGCWLLAGFSIQGFNDSRLGIKDSRMSDSGSVISD